MDAQDEDGNSAEEMDVGSPTASQAADVLSHEQNEDWDDEAERGSIPAPADYPIPPHLKEISSLASWTVSTYKPGSGVAALRHPSPSQYWQSDGPQPHTLNVHFFKFVAISYMRIYIDFQQDESYTPIKLEFLAGTGHHDLQLVCEMAPKEPKGWIEVDLSNAGGPATVTPSELRAIDEEEEIQWAEQQQSNPETPQDEAASSAARRRSQLWHRIGTGSTLRCFLVQLRILENHQNGKDTHLRGLQLFARDEAYVVSRRRQPQGVHGQRASFGQRRTTAGLGDTHDVFGGGGGITWLNEGRSRRSVPGAGGPPTAIIPPSEILLPPPVTRSNTSGNTAGSSRPQPQTRVQAQAQADSDPADRILRHNLREIAEAEREFFATRPGLEAAAEAVTTRKREERLREPDWMGEIERSIGGWEVR